jgi:hypothetical protein
LLTRGSELKTTEPSNYAGAFRTDFYTQESGAISHYCAGFNRGDDSTSWFKQFALDDTIEYTAGFAARLNFSTTGPHQDGESKTLSSDLRYTIVDAAVALTLGAATIASTAANMF